MSSFIAHVVDFCTRHAWLVIFAAALLGAASAIYTARHFAISTDVSKLLSPDLPWRQRELAYQAAFPQQTESIVAVVEGPTPELATSAAAALTDELKQQPKLFRSVSVAGGGEFFDRNKLLYLPPDNLSQMTQRLTTASLLLGMLTRDPSLRGLGQVLRTVLEGVHIGRLPLDSLARPLNMAADTFDDILADRPATFSWLVLLGGAPAKPEELRRIVEIWPVLDYSALEPGAVATAAIRAAADKAKLASDFQSTLRLTGPVVISDDEFATLREGALRNGVITAAIVLLILWLALRSVRIVAAVAVTVGVGLAVASALGLMLVGALNPLSVAFAVLFVGLGADFAIQFSVRYRVERHENDDLRGALVRAAGWVGAPLTLAAAAAAAGFLSFLPTSYSGLAQLGLISGCGMVVAYVASMTLLPALLRAFQPPPERKPLGFAALAPADHFLHRHRAAVVVTTLFVALAGLPSLMQLHFDFNPLSLRSQNSEPVATLLLLSKDPTFDVNAAQVLVPPAEVASVSKQLSALPQVAHVRSLESFIPADQDEKLRSIRAAASTLNPQLTAPRTAAPSDAENVAALRTAAKALLDTAGQDSGTGAQAARRLAADLNRLADATAALRERAQAAFVRPLETDLQALRRSLQAQPVTRASLPADLVRAWTAPDGRTRVEAAPAGDPNDSQNLRRFALAVLAAQPTATGQAVETYEWGEAIIVAFIQAGVWALCSIAILLFVVLRRIRDVLLTLVPLLVAGAVTLEICALTGFALNYANIIALPVLLGIGVAFKIYYVTAWRRGETNFLESALTRAVLFSALMTATAFGSLWLSAHPGTSSMGKLLALSLLCTLASAALFQPALMGPPRKKTE
jgi:hopanoid biosynthesis associated RND transporter like protein HpnN